MPGFHSARRANGRQAVRASTHALFACFVCLALSTPSWRVGPFAWLPIIHSPMLAGRPADVGVLSLLPLLVVLGWGACRSSVGRDPVERRTRAWRWGRPGVTLPLAGLTLLVLLGLDAALTWRTTVEVVGMGLLWLVYLFGLNENPRLALPLALPLALVLLVQGGVALAQFLLQRDVGLTVLGELPLNREASGVSVLWAREQRWLRAYGLTGHPNALGAHLVVLLLLLLPDLVKARGWRRVALTVVVSVGLLGLSASFSRAAWLAYALGVLVWLAQAAVRARKAGRRWPKVPYQMAVPIAVAAVFLFAHSDLVLSRFANLDTPIEASSLDERQRDAQLAFEVIGRHPVWGVGAGNYLAAVRAFEPDSRPVHNVVLLVTAELGLVGLVLWLCLAGAGLRSSSQGLGVWLAILLVGLFDVGLWVTAGWDAAILYALVAGRIAGELPPGRQ